MGKNRDKRNGAGWTNKDLDPFEDHTPDRKFACWTSELKTLKDLLERAQKDAKVLQSDEARPYGGRLVDLRNRIKHVERKLAQPAMKFIARQRERRT